MQLQPLIAILPFLAGQALAYPLLQGMGVRNMVPDAAGQPSAAGETAVPSASEAAAVPLASDAAADAGAGAEVAVAVGDDVGAGAEVDAGAVVDAGAATATGTPAEGIDVGPCTDFSMSFRTGFAEAQSADEVRFGPSDATQFSQGAALNPLIISNAMCDTFVNACAQSATTRDVCKEVKATIDEQLAAGELARDQSYADAWLSGLETAFGITSTGRGTEAGAGAGAEPDADAGAEAGAGAEAEAPDAGDGAEAEAGADAGPLDDEAAAGGEGEVVEPAATATEVAVPEPTHPEMVHPPADAAVLVPPVEEDTAATPIPAGCPTVPAVPAQPPVPPAAHEAMPPPAAAHPVVSPPAAAHAVMPPPAAHEATPPPPPAQGEHEAAVPEGAAGDGDGAGQAPPPVLAEDPAAEVGGAAHTTGPEGDVAGVNATDLADEDTAAEPAAEAGTINIQPFTGALNGVPAPPVNQSGPEVARPFEVAGVTFLNAGAALMRSCDRQFNGCANVANAGEGEASVAGCQAQRTQCGEAIAGVIA